MGRDDVEPAKPRDTERNVAKIKEQLSNRHGWAALGKEGKRIQQVLVAMEADDWSEWSGYGYDGYYNEEDSLGPYVEAVESLEALFDRAEAAFDEGDLQLARKAYAKLRSPSP